MKRIIGLIVVLIFAAMFGYQFFSNLGDCIDIFKNITDLDVDSFAIYGRIILTTLYSFGGLIGSLAALIRIATNKTKRLDKNIGKLLTTLITGFVAVIVISVLPTSIMHNDASIFTDDSFVKLYLILGFGIVASVGLRVKKGTLVQSIVTTIGLIGIIVIDILLMKENELSFDYFDIIPETMHSYIFLILGSALVGLYVWWKPDEPVAE